MIRFLVATIFWKASPVQMRTTQSSPSSTLGKQHGVSIYCRETSRNRIISTYLILALHQNTSSSTISNHLNLIFRWLKYQSLHGVSHGTLSRRNSQSMLLFYSNAQHSVMDTLQNLSSPAKYLHTRFEVLRQEIHIQ